MDPALVGAALRVALIAPSIVPPPFWKDRKPLTAEFVKSAGVRSLRQLESGARYCSIAASDGRLTIEPYRNGGTRGDKKGFQPFGAPKTFISETVSDEALGLALVQALALAE